MNIESAGQMESVQNAHTNALREMNQQLLAMEQHREQLHAERDTLQAELEKLSAELNQRSAQRNIGRLLLLDSWFTAILCRWFV